MSQEVLQSINVQNKSSQSIFSKTKWEGTFAVASVLFGSHAGGGFATGNQATEYFVQYGRIAPIMAILAMAIFTLAMRECIIMYNNHGFTSYRQLFEELWNPYKKLSILWEVYYYIMVVSAVGAVIAGTASLFEGLGISYAIGVLLVGIILLLLTIFGAQIISRSSSIMSITILICSGVIFLLGISAKSTEIAKIMQDQVVTQEYATPILKVFTYAGFQSVVIPTLISCGKPLKTSKKASRAMFIAFIMNAIALGLSCLMLLGWYADFTAANVTDLPNVYISNQLGVQSFYSFYSISLFLCFVSTGVTTVYGVINRFENHRSLKKYISNITIRRAAVAIIIMSMSMGISMVGLSNIIKYAYGYCGYLGIIIIILPMLTIGRHKNKKFLKAHPERVGE